MCLSCIVFEIFNVDILLWNLYYQHETISQRTCWRRNLVKNPFSLLTSQASWPYNKIGTHFVISRHHTTSSVAILPILPHIALTHDRRSVKNLPWTLWNVLNLHDKCLSIWPLSSMAGMCQTKNTSPHRWRHCVWPIRRLFNVYDQL